MSTSRGQPLYLALADRLAAAIASGRYPIGAQLPSESELCRQFRASRFTVREAIRQLQSQGLVRTRHGTGTEVTSRAPAAGRFTFSFDSVPEFLHSVEKTRLVDVSAAEVPADRDLAQVFGIAAGEPLVRIQSTRVAVTATGRAGRPVAVAVVHLPAAYAAVVEELTGNLGVTISAALEQRFGIVTARIDQTLEPCALSADEAARLKMAPGTLALRFERRYRDPRGDVFELARSVQAGRDSRISMAIHSREAR